MAVSIRAATVADRERVVALWRIAFPDNPPHNDPGDDFDAKLRHDTDLLFVATDDSDAILGTAMAGWDGHRGWIYALAVLPTSRRAGVGAALLEHAESALSARGCRKVNLQVREGNEAVADFYARRGYMTEPRISMGKLLTSR